MFPWLSTLRKDRNSDVHAFARAYYGGPACGGGGQASRLSHDESRRNRSRRPPTSSAQPSLSHAGLTGRSPDRAGRSPRYVALGNAGRYYSATGRSAGGDFPLLPPEQPSDDGAEELARGPLAVVEAGHLADPFTADLRTTKRPEGRCAGTFERRHLRRRLKRTSRDGPRPG